MQEIVAKRDLRLLDQASNYWIKSKEEPIAVPQESKNFIRKKINGPVSNEDTSIYLEFN